MERDVTFVERLSSKEDKGYPTEAERYLHPKLELRMKFVIHGTSYWSISAEIVRETRVSQEVPGEKFCVFRTVCEVVHSERVVGKPEDLLLAKAALSTDDDTAKDLAHRLYWDYILTPSLKVDFDGVDSKENNWFKTHARGTWNFHMRSILYDREQQCQDVHDR